MGTATCLCLRSARLRAALFTVATLLLISGCRSRAGEGNGQQPSPEQHFVRGRVISVDKGQQSVLLAHEAIPGFMPAMTMDYKVADPAVLSEVHAGDRITADLLNDRDAAGPTHLRLSGVDVIAQARPDAAPSVPPHIPQIGEAVPDFTLLNQSDRHISLGQFRGKVLLLTFVYTRCPLADFCPRMSRNFAEIDKRLQLEPKRFAQTHLLTISFDPTYDTPKVLRSYGGAYTGRYSQETFGHWDFAAPGLAELPRMEHWFGVGVTPEGATLQHSLSTVVIGADGRVLAFYPTNEWTADDVLKVVGQALG